MVSVAAAGPTTDPPRLGQRGSCVRAKRPNHPRATALTQTPVKRPLPSRSRTVAFLREWLGHAHIDSLFFQEPPLEEGQARETLADRIRALGHDPVALITLAIHSRSFRRPQSTEEAFAGPSNPDSPQRQLTPNPNPHSVGIRHHGATNRIDVQNHLGSSQPSDVSTSASVQHFW